MVVFLTGAPVLGGATAQVEFVFVRAVHAVLLTVIHIPGFNHLTAVAHEPVVAVVVILIVATVVNAKPILDEFTHRVFKFGLEVFSHCITKGFTGMKQNVAHHDEHDRVARRAGVTSRDIKRVSVSKVDLKWFIRAHAECDIVHVSFAFVVAFAGEFVADADVKLTSIEAKLFHRQTGEVDVVVGRADVGTVDHAAHVVDLGIAPIVGNAHGVAFLNAFPNGLVVGGSGDIDGARVAKAPFGLRSDGVAEVHAGVKIDVEFFAVAFQSDVDAEVHVVAHRHIKVHVGANELVLVVEVLGVEHVHGQHVLGFGDDVDVKARRFATEGGLRPVGHDDGVGQQAVAKHHVAGAAPHLDVVAFQVLNGLRRDVLGLVNVNVGSAGGQLTEVKIEPCGVGVLHDLREQFLDVQAGHVLEVAVKA